MHASRESDDRRKEREANAAREFRYFLSTYRAAVSPAARGASDEAVSSYLHDAKLHGRDLLARLLRRMPTEAEVETLIRF